VGSRYKFSIASTYEQFCPTLRDKLGSQSKVPATQAAISASKDVVGLQRISAGNYGGWLGKSFVSLDRTKQPVGCRFFT